MSNSAWWFSAMVEYALHIENEHTYRLIKSVLLVRAGGFDEAFAKVLTSARGRETEYRNDNGALVRWILIRVVTLDWLDARLASGREVYSEPCDIVPLDSLDFDFAPEHSEWGSSGV